MKFTAKRLLPLGVLQVKDLTETHIIKLRKTDIHGDFGTVYLNEIPFPGAGDPPPYDTMIVKIDSQLAIIVNRDPEEENEVYIDWNNGVLYFVKENENKTVEIIYKGCGGAVDWETLYHQFSKPVVEIGNFKEDDLEARKFKTFSEAIKNFSNSSIFIVESGDYDNSLLITEDCPSIIENIVFISRGNFTSFKLEKNITFRNCHFLGGRFNFYFGGAYSINFNECIGIAINIGDPLYPLPNYIIPEIEVSGKYGNLTINQQPNYTNINFNRDIETIILKNLSCYYLITNSIILNFQNYININFSDLYSTFVNFNIDDGSTIYNINFSYRPPAISPEVNSIIEFNDLNRSELYFSIFNLDQYTNLLLNNPEKILYLKKFISGNKIEKSSIEISEFVDFPELNTSLNILSICDIKNIINSNLFIDNTPIIGYLDYANIKEVFKVNDIKESRIEVNNASIFFNNSLTAGSGIPFIKANTEINSSSIKINFLHITSNIKQQGYVFFDLFDGEFIPVDILFSINKIVFTKIGGYINGFLPSIRFATTKKNCIGIHNEINIGNIIPFVGNYSNPHLITLNGMSNFILKLGLLKDDMEKNINLEITPDCEKVNIFGYAKEPGYNVIINGRNIHITNLRAKHFNLTDLSDYVILVGCHWDEMITVSSLSGKSFRYSKTVNIGPGAQECDPLIGNIDGGTASSVFTTFEEIDGGGSGSNFYEDINGGSSED